MEAECGSSARSDLSGGRLVTAVPTTHTVRLEIINNGSKSMVHTFVYADNAIQATALAQSMAGPGGRIVFGPYPVQ